MYNNEELIEASLQFIIKCKKDKTHIDEVWIFTKLIRSIIKGRITIWQFKPNNLKLESIVHDNDDEEAKLNYPKEYNLLWITNQDSSRSNHYVALTCIT